MLGIVWILGILTETDGRPRTPPSSTSRPSTGAPTATKASPEPDFLAEILRGIFEPPSPPSPPPSQYDDDLK